MKEPLAAPEAGSWKSRNVLALGWVSFFTDVHSETILALLPQFMANVLHLRMEAIGAIEGVAEAVASLLKIISGWFSDKLGRRKPVVLAGYVLSTLVKPLLALAQNGWHVLAVRLLDRTGKGIRTSARDALIADSTDPDQRGRAYGFHRGMDTAGAVLGTVLAVGLLNALAGDYRRVFLVSTAAGVAAVLTIVLGVREAPRRDGAAKKQVRPLPGSYRLFLIAHFLFSAGNLSYAFMLLRAQDLGVAAAAVPLYYLWHNLVYAAAALPAGALFDRLGARRAQVAAYLLHAVTCLGFGPLATKLGLPLWFAIYGIELGAIGGCSRAAAAGLMDPDRRGTQMGWFHGCEGFGLLAAGLIAGWLWERHGATTAFTYGAAMAVVGAVLAAVAIKPNAAAEGA